MKQWTKEEKEWLGYKRRLANQDKSTVSLSKAPWETELPSQLEVRPIIEGSLSLLTPKINVS